MINEEASKKYMERHGIAYIDWEEGKAYLDPNNNDVHRGNCRVNWYPVNMFKAPANNAGWILAIYRGQTLEVARQHRKNPPVLPVRPYYLTEKRKDTIAKYERALALREEGKTFKDIAKDVYGEESDRAMAKILLNNGKKTKECVEAFLAWFRETYRETANRIDEDADLFWEYP